MEQWNKYRKKRYKPLSMRVSAVPKFVPAMEQLEQ